MISARTAENFNALMHKLESESRLIMGVTCAFKKGGHKGFAAFSSNEGHERWRYSQKVKYFIEKFGQEVKLGTIPEAKTTYASPVEALASIYGADMEIRNLIKVGIKLANEDEDYEAAYYMLKIGKMMLHEVNEVDNVMKMVKNSGGTPEGLSRVDYWLYKEYYEDHDHEHKKYDYYGYNPCGK